MQNQAPHATPGNCGTNPFARPLALQTHLRLRRWRGMWHSRPPAAAAGTRCREPHPPAATPPPLPRDLPAASRRPDQLLAVHIVTAPQHRVLQAYTPMTQPSHHRPVPTAAPGTVLAPTGDLPGAGLAGVERHAQRHLTAPGQRVVSGHQHALAGSRQPHCGQKEEQGGEAWPGLQPPQALRFMAKTASQLNQPSPHTAARGLTFCRTAHLWYCRLTR